MPAIQPARLKQQAALLAEHFDQPAAFARSLHHLLDFYADRVHRPGQAGEPPPLLQAYKVRPPVLRQLVQELAPRSVQQPEQALALCDALWAQPYLEFGLLAAHLLGELPPTQSVEVLKRVQAWITPSTEERLVDALLIDGLAGLRRSNPAALLELVESWLNDSDLFCRQLGLRALKPLVSDPSFANLPVFFRMLQPLARAVPPSLRPDLLDVLAALAHRSPSETAYFLRQSLELPESPDTAWLIRQSLREFPPETEESLRRAARGMRAS